MTPTVSTIIPTYNRRQMVLRAVRSVPADEEVVVVDDGSEDWTTSALKDLHRPRLRIVGTAHRGAAAARNVGLETSRGRYVRFLDSDDWLLRGASAAQVAAIQAGADVVYGDWCDAAEGPIGTRPVLSSRSMGPLDDPVEALLSDRWAACFCYLIRRELAARVRWDERLAACQDFDFALRLGIQGGRFVHVPVEVGCYFHHSGPRLSRDDLPGWCDARRRVLLGAIDLMSARSEWSAGRRHAMAGALLHLARVYSAQGRDGYRECIEAMSDVAPNFAPPRRAYGWLMSRLGYERTEALVGLRRRVMATLRLPKRSRSYAWV